MKTSNLEHDPKKVASVALQFFFNLSKQWKLTAEQERILLGSPSETKFISWKINQSANQLDSNIIERISYLMDIQKALLLLLPQPAAANRWVKRPNSAALFKGESALYYMLQGNISNLEDVRRYLDKYLNS